MNTYSLESFINFCDDMMIAEEAINFKSIRDFGKNILQFIKTIWNGFVNILKWIKRKLSEKIGRNRIKPSVEISRLNEENRMLKEKLEETQELLEKTTNALYNETDISSTLTEKLEKSQYDIDELQNKVDKLQKDLVENFNRKKECEEAIKVLDSIYNDINNYKKITSYDIRTCNKKINEFEEEINDALHHSTDELSAILYDEEYIPDDDFRRDMDSRSIRLTEERHRIFNSVSENVEKYEKEITKKEYGSLHRIQLYYIAESINLISNDVEELSAAKEKLEILIKKISNIKDDGTNKRIIRIRQLMQELVGDWANSITNDQNLIKLLSRLIGKS